MGLLPPGVAQGILDAQQQQMADAKNKQAMEYQAWQIEQAKQAQARQTQSSTKLWRCVKRCLWWHGSTSCGWQSRTTTSCTWSSISPNGTTCIT